MLCPRGESGKRPRGNREAERGAGFGTGRRKRETAVHVVRFRGVCPKCARPENARERLFGTTREVPALSAGKRKSDTAVSGRVLCGDDVGGNFFVSLERGNRRKDRRGRVRRLREANRRKFCLRPAAGAAALPQYIARLPQGVYEGTASGGKRSCTRRAGIICSIMRRHADADGTLRHARLFGKSFLRPAAL